MRLRFFIAAVLSLFISTAALAQGKYGIPSYVLPPTNPGQLPAFTVAKLPLCSGPTRGMLVVVTDANSPTFGGSLTGGSTTTTLALCNGTSWLAH